MKLIVRYIVALNRINNVGKTSIGCRITYGKQRIQFSTGLFINPKSWNSKHQKAEPPNEENDFINIQLSLIKSKINKVFLWLQVQENNFIVNDIYRLYKGVKLRKEYNVIEYFEHRLNKLKKLIGIDIKQVTWDKSYYVKNNVKSFILWKFQQKDIPLNKLKLHFLDDLEYYLKVEKKQKQITVNKTIQRFRNPIKVAVAEGYLDKGPFMLHKTKMVRNEVVYLSVKELEKLEKHEFSQPRLQQVKDWFVFSCYTGLAYNELKNLLKQHIVIGFDEQLWIEMLRQKTQKNITIPLLPKAKQLIDKYSTDDSDVIFPMISNQRYNSYLKEIASILGINKRLTTHTGRKTFASTVLLYNDVPMEIVSELLGHSNMKITQEHYGKIVQKKVSDEMLKLKSKLLN
ncbi:MAG: tyrosine-type recombinase/integrase [Flavobacteriaceae bacterium]|nr:tyrosine-type recombinase/integrase [Flavobacteriaceae bacterium]